MLNKLLFALSRIFFDHKQKIISFIVEIPLHQ